MDNIKSQLQEREFAVLKNEKRVILKWATGCGKSKMVIDLINYSFNCGLWNWPAKVLFVVAERAHINNWKEEFKKWGLKSLNCEVDIICYASLHKAEDKYDIIVFDEAHHLFTEKRLACVQNLRARYVYLLSATLSSSKIDAIEEIFGKFTTSTVTLKDAIKSDILPDPKVYVIDMELDNKKANQEIKIGSGDNLPEVRWEDRHKYLSKNTSCIIRCTQYQKYVYLTTTMEYWKQRYERSRNDFHRNRWVNLGSQRKRFIGELKTEAVYKLIQRIPSKKKYVCFCASVAQAGVLSMYNTISSQKSSKYNQAVIDRFNDGHINSIYAVGMITEGMNLNKIDMGIITQLDGKERLFIQKTGRVLRADSPIVCIFYFKNTQDEVYLKSALENIDGKYIKRLNINQLSTIKL